MEQNCGQNRIYFEDRMGGGLKKNSKNICHIQARRSGYDESRKTHIQGCLNSSGNWLHTYTIQCGCGMLRQ